MFTDYLIFSEVKLHNKSRKHRRRSKRRAIYCSVHGCYLDSVSPKHKLYADTPEQLQQRGIKRQSALILIATKTAVALDNEWLEAFWCDQCQQTKWYRVKKYPSPIPGQEADKYEISLAPQKLWQQATGVICPQGNASVGEFTLRQARMADHHNIRDFHFRV
ncbi:hypothetical protein NIES4103_31050 [Nostoc sp. NIES-4103]|nr:hypothetical protein NIES4103_31050 [Nostoc sp. NIES-4103]